MSKNSRDLKLLRQNDHDLMAQYNELLGLRAELQIAISFKETVVSQAKDHAQKKDHARKSVGSETKLARRASWPPIML